MGTKNVSGRESTIDGSNEAAEPGSSSIGAIYKWNKEANGQVRISLNTVKVKIAPHATEMTTDSSNSDSRGENEGGEIKDEATWADVGRACCIHSCREWFNIFLFFVALAFLLYFFLFGLDLMGTSFKVVGGCTAGSILSADTNPMASVMIGIIATTLLQSSSTTTAIIVSLVSGGLDVQQGIYMVMGANVGTSITCMLVSLVHMGDGEELERAFAGSALFWAFKFLTLIILLPVEITTQYLYRITKAMLPASVADGEQWEGPIKKMVSPLVRRVIVANKQLIDDISIGKVESCSAPGVYPVSCLGGVESYSTCHANTTETAIGVIGCDKHTGDCPLFFQNGASKQDDMVSGWVCMIISLTILILCLMGLVALLRKMLLGASTQVLYKATNINPYLAILIGTAVTVLVQSSSITTSTLVPLAGVGVLNLEAMYPLVIGAGIGTTCTALMAALVSSKVESLQIALSHLFFNLTGLVIWYPIPFMRRIVIRIAQMLGKATRHWISFPIFFILAVFFILPLALLGISSCFGKKSIGFTALGSFLLLLVAWALGYFLFWWFFCDGKTKLVASMARRQRRAAAIQALADDMNYLKVDTEWCKNEIGRLKDFASSLPIAVVRQMEEGRSLVPPTATPREQEAIAMEDDDRLSTFESCRSKPWKDIFYKGASSVRSQL